MYLEARYKAWREMKRIDLGCLVKDEVDKTRQGKTI